jgi:hypothetical protein
MQGHDAAAVHLALELQSVEAVLAFFLLPMEMGATASEAPPEQIGFINSPTISFASCGPIRRGGGISKDPEHGVSGTTIIFSICNELALMGTFEGAQGTKDGTAAETAQTMLRLRCMPNARYMPAVYRMVKKNSHSVSQLTRADRPNDQDDGVGLVQPQHRASALI